MEVGHEEEVVNISTKKRYEKFYSSLGAEYSYSNGSRAKIDAKVADKIIDGLYYTIGGNYRFVEGYRDGDIAHLGGVNATLTWDINPSNSLQGEVSYFKSLQATTPLLCFSTIPSPSISDRSKAGDGEILISQDRISSTLGYEGKFGSEYSLSLKAFFHHYKLGYEKKYPKYGLHLYELFLARYFNFSKWKLLCR